MKITTLLSTFAIGAIALGFTGCCSTCCEDEGPCVGGVCSTTPENAPFYKNGKFDQTAAKKAYFELMEKFNCPIYPALKTNDFWVADFGLNDFANVGMGGIFWMNPNHPKGGYLSHEIYLLPGQMIVEHKHVETKEGPAKRESWMVRHGSVYAFSKEAKAMEGTCPVKIPQSQIGKGFTCNNWALLKAGDVAHLNRVGEVHFLIAGPEGAIVTETGIYHDFSGNRYTNPDVKM